MYMPKQYVIVIVKNAVLSASSQAYPEYLITYQIMKPDTPSQTATAAEQKT